jgi:hypothetical protein
VKEGTALHLFPAKNGRNLHERLNVVCRVEDRELVREDRHKHDPRRPDINRDRLIRALEEHLWCAEPSRARAVGLDGRPRIFLPEPDAPVARLRALGRVVYCLLDCCCVASTRARSVQVRARRRSVLARRAPWGVVPLRKAKIDEQAIAALVVEQEVGGLDVAVQDAAGVDVLEAAEKAGHVLLDLGWVHERVEVAEIVGAVEREDDHDLILIAEG